MMSASSFAPSAAEIHAVFARRVVREKTARGLNTRELAAKSGLSLSTVWRAENGREVWLSSALAITAALGMPLAEMFTPPECGRCDGRPPAGFACPDCGRLGAS